ncbi:flagellar associated protein [Monoraphidium neglectum]|uniref:Flagellar associated protein n=1 Tax=Monoraphidium neglectum TaxID=145388 RepID=A0A0D2JIT6_9CHLO|nr:flagellar associated protein [Monoraphidium neglectum]KIY99232.1 flagellar associated protein [Monoraphidium neglectum]|eukprot:XP_013898252.1 flagellar associated protein [Monoraphidium neglectum]
MSLSALLHGDTFFLDDFAVRQWDDPNYSGTRISHDKADFVAKVHELFKQSGAKLVDGYAPFCKHEAAVQPVPVAAHLDLILYSREQLVEEYRAMPSKSGGQDPDLLLPKVPWGIISVKAQNEDYETPMQPITMIRNALGREEGGSGVPLNRDAYEASCNYWQHHAPIVAGEEPSGE